MRQRRIEKPRRKRRREQVPVPEPLPWTMPDRSLLKEIEDVLEEIDRALDEAGRS